MKNGKNKITYRRSFDRNNVSTYMILSSNKNKSKLEAILKNCTYTIDSIDSNKLSALSSAILSNKYMSDEYNILCQLESTEENEKRKIWGEGNEDRYSDICPYEYNNVKLSTKNYINASFMHVS